MTLAALRRRREGDFWEGSRWRSMRRTRLDAASTGEAPARPEPRRQGPRSRPMALPPRSRRPAAALSAEEGRTTLAAAAQQVDEAPAGDGTALAQVGPPDTVVGDTLYEVGPPVERDVFHDNGFLQNPNDPTNPVPQPTREPTWEERAYHAGQVAAAAVGSVAAAAPGSDWVHRLGALDNALPAYQHFLTGGGADRGFDYGEYLKDDPSGRAQASKLEADARVAADALHDQAGVALPQEAGRSATFQMRSDVMTTGADGFGYPATEDWQKAIGGHSFWTDSEVTLTRLEDGRLQAEATITVTGEDRYNFNPGQADIATGTPDAERGRLEEAGLAHQYTQTGTATLTTSWIVGEPGQEVPPVNGGGR